MAYPSIFINITLCRLKYMYTYMRACGLFFVVIPKQIRLDVKVQ